MTRFLSSLFLLLASFTLAHAAGPQVLSFFSPIDDSEQPYAIYSPPKLVPGKRYPLVVSLHGAWSNHRINLHRVFGQGNRPGEDAAPVPSSAPGRTIVIASGAPLWTERPDTSTSIWRIIAPNLRTLMRADGGIFLFNESTGATLLDGRLAILKSKANSAILEVK